MILPLSPQSSPTSPTSQKSETAFRTIAEAATELNLEPHVLRFWETKFHKIKPTKARGGRRYYRPEDIQILKTIRDLLYVKGYTIRGVQQLLRDKSALEGKDFVVSATPAGSIQEAPVVSKTPTQVIEPFVLSESVASPINENKIDSNLQALEPIIAELQELRDLLKKAAS